MKISELSHRSGVPVATIKFYIREGLLPAGAHTAKNQARYSEAHVELLDLVRVLKDDLQMSVATIARVIAVDPQRGHEFVSEGLEAVAASRPRATAVDRSSTEYRNALARVREVVQQMGWSPRESDGRFQEIVDAVATVLRIWPYPIPAQTLLPYATAAKDLAEVEIPEDWNPAGDALRSFKYAVLGTYLFEPILLALRRMAHVERSRVLSERRERATPVQPKKRSASRPKKAATRKRT